MKRTAPISILISRFTVYFRTNGLLWKIFIICLLSYIGSVLTILLIFPRSFSVRCISVDSHGSVRLNIRKFEIKGSTVWARDGKVSIVLCFLGHITDAVATDIILAAWGDKDCVEVAQANRAVVLVDLASCQVISPRVLLSYLNVSLRYSRFNAHFIPFA